MMKRAGTLDKCLMRQWAELLVKHSLEVKENDLIAVYGEVITKPLMEAIEIAVLKCNAHPLLLPYFDTRIRGYNSGLAAILSGKEEELDYTPKFLIEMFKEINGFIYIIGTDSPFLFKQYSKEISRIRKANQGLSDLRLSKPWVVTLFPTPNEAQVEGFKSYTEYADLVIKASLQDYQKMREEQIGLKHIMSEAMTIELNTYYPDGDRILTLAMNVENTTPRMCYGKHNIPDGEVFTSPNYRSVEGEIYLDVPVFRDGNMIEGVYLEIKNGKIIKYNAKTGLNPLKSVIESDNGSDQIGEIAIGTNAGITKNFRNILFAEKIGGTIHIAIGSSYSECYGIDKVATEEVQLELNRLATEGKYSRSSQHLDIPKDYRSPKMGERILIGDTRLVWEDNRWQKYR